MIAAEKINPFFIIPQSPRSLMVDPLLEGFAKRQNSGRLGGAFIF